MLLLLCNLYILHIIYNLCLLFSFDFIVFFQLSSVCGYIVGYQFRHYIAYTLTFYIGDFLQISVTARIKSKAHTLFVFSQLAVCPFLLAYPLSSRPLLLLLL